MDEKTVFQPRFDGVGPGVQLNGVYEIESLLARGGMGEVFRGFNIQTRDPVAIKMIRAEMSSDDNVVALFRREASTLFNLHHEAIVRYFVFSVDPTLRRAYLAMEFVEGPSLSKRIAERPLSLEEAHILVARIGAALDAAHRLGVVHRDISPDNIILPDGDVRKAKLIDFGIARTLQTGQATIIGDGFAGKYNYASPEQLGLAGGQVTGKSDLYSFGLVLAEALAGRALDMGGTQFDIVEKRRRTPDLTAAPAAFRPLLQALLKPNPADRPASMAAAAAFERPPAAAHPPSGGGRMAAVAAVALILASLAGLGYVFRDDFANQLARLSAGSGPEKNVPPTPTPTVKPTTTPPPLASPTPSATPTSTPSETPTPTAEPSTTPGVEALLDAAPPRAAQAALDLPPGVVGKPYSAPLPAFADPGGKGLSLSAERLPDGLTLRDRGDGSGEIAGVPTSAGASAVRIIATNRHGRTADMIANLSVVAPLLAPQPSQPSVTLADATAGRSYNAALPPFRGGSDQRGLSLRVEPDPPEGMVFADAGAGFSMLSGAPTKPGVYGFDVVASDSNGPGGRMAVRLKVLPGAATPPVKTATPTPVATPTPIVDAETRVAAFLKTYDGGPCFFAAPRSGAPRANAVEAVGSDRAAFSRFEAAFKHDLALEPEVAATLISAGQCPLLELLKHTAASGAAPGRIALDLSEIGGGKPLSGRVSGLGGRRLLALFVDNDGDARQLPVSLEPSGDGATFSTPPLHGDADSFGKAQAVVAILSDQPLAAASALRGASIENYVKTLAGEGRGLAASVAYFRFVR